MRGLERGQRKASVRKAPTEYHCSIDFRREMFLRLPISSSSASIFSGTSSKAPLLGDSTSVLPIISFEFSAGKPTCVADRFQDHSISAADFSDSNAASKSLRVRAWILQSGSPDSTFSPTFLISLNPTE